MKTMLLTMTEVQTCKGHYDHARNSFCSPVCPWFVSDHKGLRVCVLFDYEDLRATDNGVYRCKQCLFAEEHYLLDTERSH